MTWAKAERVLNDAYNLEVELQHEFGSARFQAYCKGKKVLRLNEPVLQALFGFGESDMYTARQKFGSYFVFHDAPPQVVSGASSSSSTGDAVPKGQGAAGVHCLHGCPPSRHHSRLALTLTSAHALLRRR